MDFPFTINTQDELDKLFKDRLAREARKYEGFDAFKAKAEELDTLKAQDYPGQLATANQSIADLKGQLEKAAEEAKAKYDADAKSIADLTEQLGTANAVNLRTKAALKEGLPFESAEYLKGSTEEELATEAKHFAEIFGRRAQPTQPLGGNDPAGGNPNTVSHPFIGEVSEQRKGELLAALAQSLTGQA